MIFFGWGLALCAIVVVFVIIGLAFNNSMQWSFDEVSRAPYPQANFDAVLVETNGGATTSFGYEVFILPRGKKPARSDQPVANLYGAGRNERAYGVNLKWTSNETLAVEYLDAQDAELLKSSLSLDGHMINVAMKSGVSDPTAPPGGMLYNLERRR